MAARGRRRVAILLAALAAVPATRPGAEEEDDLPRGEQLYLRSCASCHGPAGEGGRGPALARPDLSHAPDRESLVTVIRRGIPGTAMPSSKLSARDQRHVAAFVAAMGAGPRERLPGDPRRGERVYFGAGACATCHTIRGRGGAFGPDLTHIGRLRGADHLRASMVDPAADLPRSFSTYRTEGSLTLNFLQVRVVTADGRRLSGARVNEDTFSIQLRDPAGQIHSLFKSDLAELHRDWGTSPMPGYRHLPDEELDDLVAFLASLRGEATP